jgi:SAM-dependent methyltransferase
MDPMPAAPIDTTFSTLAATAESGDRERFARELAASAAALRAYLLSLELEGAPPGLTQSYVGDAFQRFLNTLQLIPLPVRGRILELGANPYFFHLLLRRLFPRATVEGANFFAHDIFSTEVGSVTQRVRSPAFHEEWSFTCPSFNLEMVPRYPYPAASFDLVFFCETFEHLVVNPLAVLRKIRRLLAPGGHLIVTLPNATRLSNLACMLDGYNFFDLYHPENGVHGRHNREFTLAEMKALLALHGLVVRRAETRDRFDYDRVPMQAVDYSGPPVELARRHADLQRLLQSAKGSLVDRGDNLYLLAERPSPPPLPPSNGRPTALQACRPVAAASPRVMAFVDVVADDPQRLRLVGWAFLTDELGTEHEWLELILRSDDLCFSAPCRRMGRPDVVAQHGLDRDDPGYEAVVDKSALPPGRYRVGVRLGGPGLEDGFRDLSLETTVG